MSLEHALNPTPLSPLVAAYLGTALLAGLDDRGVTLDPRYQPTAFGPESVERATLDVTDFLRTNADLLARGQIIHDEAADLLWLSRNRLDGGFLTLGLGDTGRALDANARAYGEQFVLIGADGAPALS